MKLLSTLLLFVLVTTCSLQAQRNCSSMEVLEMQLQENPQQEEIMRQIEKFTRESQNNPSKMVDGVITIPVVFHIVWNTNAENISDAQVESQLQILTDDFRRFNADADNTWGQATDTEIQFCMASVDPNGNATNGITRTNTSTSAFSANDNMKFNSSGGKDAWPAADYLNFWVCDLSGGLLGYAQFPGGPASTDGVVCDYQYVGNIGTATAPFNLGRTGTHEVGHWLNLRHIWGDGGCNVDDFVSDTPTSDASNVGCAVGHVSCGSTDMVQNYMDYSDDACMNLYTVGQKDRMRALFDPGGFRESLLSSNGCGSGTGPTCTDGVQNGNETGVDCGGPDCGPCESTCSNTEVIISITLDNYPEETSWTVQNENGNVIASGGTYGSQPDGSTVTETLCLADGCYDFTINDSFGDGICCSYGNGSYAVVAAGTTVASGGNFGSSETTNFCLGGGSGPTCTDGIQNGNETGVDCGGSCSPCPIPGCTNPSAHNYNPNATQNDGSCETCIDGVQNGDETGVDCGGSLCDPCNNGGCTDVNINFNNFDSSWGIWNDGGSDCRRSANDAAYAYSGNRCVRLRDNTSSSNTTTDNLNLAGFEEVTVDFTYLGISMENGEDFWLQVSLNGGSTYQTVVDYNSGTEFQNGVREFETVVLTGTFTSTTRFRFRCDASANGDRIYLDDVELTGCTSGGNRETIGVAHLSEFEIDKVYPNPAAESLTLRVNNPIDAMANISLIDLQGKRVLGERLDVISGTQELTINVAHINTGIYFLHYTSGDKTVVEKIVIAR